MEGEEEGQGWVGAATCRELHYKGRGHAQWAHLGAVKRVVSTESAGSMGGRGRSLSLPKGRISQVGGAMGTRRRDPQQRGQAGGISTRPHKGRMLLQSGD